MPAIFTPASNVSHPEVVPYISVADYQSAPTSVDTTALVPGGTFQAQAVELANVIRRASGWANNLCFQILAATLDTQNKFGVLVKSDGTIRVVCDFWPVLEVDSFVAGPTVSTAAPIVDTDDMGLEGRSTLVVPVMGMTSGPRDFATAGPLVPGRRAYCQWTYWNGWIHSTLADAVSADASSLIMTTALPEAAAGQNVAIYDDEETEWVQISPAFTGGTVVPLATPTVNAHTPPGFPGSITVTALPEDARQAIISLTSALIKTKGTQSYDMPSVGQEPTKSDLIAGGGMEDLSVAESILVRYHRVT